MLIKLFKQFKMKTLSLSLLASVFSLSIYSCRETTEERTEDSLEEVGNDIEGAAEEVETEYEEEVQGTEFIFTLNTVPSEPNK